jgi:hypothetical protein
MFKRTNKFERDFVPFESAERPLMPLSLARAAVCCLMLYWRRRGEGKGGLGGASASDPQAPFGVKKILPSQADGPVLKAQTCYLPSLGG